MTYLVAFFGWWILGAALLTGLLNAAGRAESDYLYRTAERCKQALTTDWLTGFWLGLVWPVAAVITIQCNGFHGISYSTEPVK